MDVIMYLIVLNILFHVSVTLKRYLPSSSWFRHCNGTNVFPSSHDWYKLLDLFLWSVMTDVGHYNVGMQCESNTSIVYVAPKNASVTDEEWKLLLEKGNLCSAIDTTAAFEAFKRKWSSYVNMTLNESKNNGSQKLKFLAKTYCSSHVIAEYTISAPIPPCSAGVLMPSKPCAPAFSHT